MKMKMATCYMIALGLIFDANKAGAQLYEYKQLDGVNSQNHYEAENNNDKKKDKDKDKDKDKNEDIIHKPTTIPFDGGLTLVLVAGAGLAFKKKYGKKAAKDQPADSK